MVREVRWTKYLWLSLLSFGAFMLEYLSIFAIEVIFLHVDIQNYTMQQRSIHCIIMVFMWAFFIGVLLLFSRKHYHFPERGSKRDKISSKSWIVTLACYSNHNIRAKSDWNSVEKRKPNSFWRYYIGYDMGSVSFCVKRGRSWNMERNFYYDVFCS